MSFGFKPWRPARQVERTHAPSASTLAAIAAQPLALPKRPPGAPWRRMIQIPLPWGKP